MKGARRKGCVRSDGSDRWQAAGNRGGGKFSGTEAVLVLPAVTVVPCSLVLRFMAASRIFWDFGSLFQRRPGVILASCCGSGNPVMQRVLRRSLSSCG